MRWAKDAKFALLSCPLLLAVGYFTAAQVPEPPKGPTDVWLTLLSMGCLFGAGIAYGRLWVDAYRGPKP